MSKLSHTSTNKQQVDKINEIDERVVDDFGDISEITSTDDGFEIEFETGKKILLPVKAGDGIVVDVGEDDKSIEIHADELKTHYISIIDTSGYAINADLYIKSYDETVFNKTNLNNWIGKSIGCNIYDDYSKYDSVVKSIALTDTKLTISTTSGYNLVFTLATIAITDTVS